MAEFSHTDFNPYQQELWHDPTIKNEGLWSEPSYKFGSIPEPLYRLRLSVLHGNEGRDDCPINIFIYPTLETLTNATNEIHDSFGGPFSNCQIQSGGLAGPGKTTDEAVMAGVEDGRTSSMVLRFDPQVADESWSEFLARLKEVEKRWTVETDSE